MINFFLIPFLSLVSISQIQITPSQVIKGEILPAFSAVPVDYVGFLPSDFILVKAILESTDKDCKSLIQDNIKTCQNALQKCSDTCKGTPEVTSNIIKALKHDKQLLDMQIEQQQNKIVTLKYITIVLGSLALSATTYSFIK